MHLETILARKPNGEQIVETIEVQDHETNEQIAFREALRLKLPVGSMVNVQGKRWGVMMEGGGKVTPYAAEGPGPMPGDVFRPKDKRRKSGFRVKAVHSDHVEGEDGRKVKLTRLKRYERVG